MTFLSRLFCVVLSLIFFQGCGANFGSEAKITADYGAAGLDLNSQAQKILETNCASCHDSRDSAGTNLTYVSDLNQLATSEYVVPGDSNSSLLYQRIAGGSMPPGSPLSETDSQIIASWITTLAAATPTPTPAPTPTPTPAPTSTPTPTPTPTPSPSPTPVATPTPAPGNPNATFAYISKNILQKSCVSCHGSDGGYSFSTYADTMKAVVAKRPNSSPLYTSIAKGRMPQGGGSISAQDTQAISDWIAAGALNN